MAHDILIIDDEDDIRKQIAGILSDEGHQAREASNSTDGFNEIASRQPSLLILDVWLNNSELDGLQMLEIINRDYANLQVIVISGHATFDMAVSATKMGAYDFISKPFKTDVLILTVERAIKDARLRRENRDLQQQSGGLINELVGNSSVLTQVRQTIDRVAPTDSRVLVTGAPGSGKSLVARILHNRSARRDGPFVILNCATLQADTLETALFGGENSDATTHVVGLLEQAHGGTLLLDEVADMSLETQGKIVRMLHSQRFQRVGGSRWIEVDVRVIATTHRDLQALMAGEQFREDLYYRLNVVPIVVPPLSARREDIPSLTQYFMSRSANAKGRAPRIINDGAMASLQAYDWPGNVWELVNVVERLLLLAPGALDVPVTSENVLQATDQDGSDVMRWDRAPELMNSPLREAREAFETEYLMFHVTRFGGNISRTAEFVGMDRAALHRKLKMLGVHNAVRQHKISA